MKRELGSCAVRAPWGRAVCRAALVCALCAQSACETPGGSPSPVPAFDSGSDPVSTPDAEAGAQETVAFPRPLKKPPPPAHLVIEPESLIGVNGNQMIALLGAPSSVSEKPPARVWQYSGASCALAIFFYMNMNNQTFQSLAYEFEGVGESVEDQQECLRQVRDGGASP